MLGWRFSLVSLALGELVLAVVFTYCASQAYNHCYVKPCYEGAGLQELWKVNKGVGMSGLAAAALVLLHSLVSLWLVPKPALGEAPLCLGVFLGITSIVALVTLEQAFIWGAEWNLIENLLKLSGENSVFYESGRHMHVREGLLDLFETTEYVSVGLLLAQCLMIAALLVWHREIITDLRLLGGFSSHGYRKIAMQGPDET